MTLEPTDSQVDPEQQLIKAFRRLRKRSVADGQITVTYAQARKIVGRLRAYGTFTPSRAYQLFDALEAVWPSTTIILGWGYDKALHVLLSALPEDATDTGWNTVLKGIGAVGAQYTLDDYQHDIWWPKEQVAHAQ